MYVSFSKHDKKIKAYLLSLEMKLSAKFFFTIKSGLHIKNVARRELNRD